jgi:hypothetical protein
MTNPTVQKLEAAAIPAVLQVIDAADAAFATIFNGDPATALARATAAAPVFLGQAELALLGGEQNEFTAVGAAVAAGFADLKAKVQALVPAAATPAA